MIENTPSNDHLHEEKVEDEATQVEKKGWDEWSKTREFWIEHFDGYIEATRVEEVMEYGALYQLRGMRHMFKLLDNVRIMIDAMKKVGITQEKIRETLLELINIGDQIERNAEDKIREEEGRRTFEAELARKFPEPRTHMFGENNRF